MRGSSFALKACVVLGFVAGSVMLSSCGGGGASAPRVVPAASGGGTAVREATITPPGNRAPVAVGSIPAQTLTVGGNPSSVDVAPYFRDPDNNLLAYSATSSRPGTVTASMSGSMVSLTPVSAGTATVTITAAGRNADATQTVVTTVQELEKVQPPVPENALTGLEVRLQGSQARKTTMRITVEPEDAVLSYFDYEIDPIEAGAMCCYQSFAESIYISFDCSVSYTGDATFTFVVGDTNGRTIRDSVSFACQ